MSVDVDFLVEDLIENVKDESFVPISQTTFQDADILRRLNNEVLRVTAKIIKQREDFFYARQTTTMLAGKDHYLIPKQASGNSLVGLFLVDPNNNKMLITRRDIGRIGEGSTDRGVSSEFYFEGDEVVLMRPPADGTNSLLFVFSRRPNRLILTESCAKITAVSSLSGTTTFTVDTDLTLTLAIGSLVDFSRAVSPFKLWASEVAITNITATTIAVATTDVEDVDGSVQPGVNDYFCPTGYTNIPMLPIEFHQVLALRTAYKMVSVLGHTDKAALIKSELNECEADALAIIKNRAEASPERPSKKNGLIKRFRL